ncbi:type IV secretion protein Rhs, partial [Pseudomonas sp. GW456-12-1-14-TSB6]|uniref:RHS repeat-associated core domain-containing protein n=1 Tax=Pseudomonas sp. GW456-12-1-14-TSB6 TaxID=2751350 RepID=UPI000CD39E9E
GLLLSEYAYDEQGRLRAHAVGHQRSALYRRDFAYSANGNLEHIADTRHGQRSYTYDALDRLIRVRHTRDDAPENFAHDPAGNLLMQDRPGPTQIKGNRLLMQGDRHYDYDAFGNLIRERRGRAQILITEYRYDSQHRLIGLTRPDGNSATYQYDAFGRRIRKTVNGQTTEFFWQGDHLIAESSPTQHRSFIYEPGTFRPLAMLDGKGPKRACPFYYQLDHLGTPQELTDYSGEIVWSAKYSAYGKVTSLELATEDYLNQPLRFQGQYFDDESGLHYNRHRYYDPDLGRYLTPDPVKLAGGLNQYQYVPNPTGWVDPLGLTSNCPPKNGKSVACSDFGEVELPDVSRRGAFRQAKADAGIPKGQQPDVQFDEVSGKPGQFIYINMTDINGKSILNDSGIPIRTRQYMYTRQDGFKLILQDHSAGHKFGDARKIGDQGPHFNIRPAANPRTGKVKNTDEHYPFRK